MYFKRLTIYKDTNGNLWKILSRKEGKFIEYWYTKAGYGIIVLSTGVKPEDKEIGLVDTIEMIESVKNKEQWS